MLSEFCCNLLNPRQSPQSREHPPYLRPAQISARLGNLGQGINGKDHSSLYYLHINETSEDSCFLPDAADRRLFELTYDPHKHLFTNPAYDERALLLLNAMQNAH